MNELIKNVVLTKTSTENEIKTYFQNVLELKQSNNDFPVNLDDVWMVVYSEKGKAVRVLKENFIENEDFVVFAQNGKNSTGRKSDIYFLSVSCLEYFIARKVRPVFEVYRRVFHKVAEQQRIPQSFSEALMLAAKQAEQIEMQHKLIAEKAIQLDESKEWYSIKRYAKENKLNWRSINWRALKAISYELGYKVKKIFDANYGEVNSYNISVFRAYFGLRKAS